VNDQVKSGKAILREFFDGLPKTSGIDVDVARILVQLYQEQKLTDKNLSNALRKQRDDIASGQAQKNSH